MSDTDRLYENAPLTGQYEGWHITSMPCISHCEMRVATTLQINLEELGMSECHCMCETNNTWEKWSGFVVNIMLKG